MGKNKRNQQDVVTASAEVSEYVIEVHLDRRDNDYHTDILHHLLVNGDTFVTDEENWTIALRDWVNSIGITTRSRSMRSIEAVLEVAGYRLSFIEQYVDYGDEDIDFNDEGSGINAASRIVRKYKVALINPIEAIYSKRHKIAGLGARIIQDALSPLYNELDMARIVEEACESILKITGEYEGKGVGNPLGKSPSTLPTPTKPEIFEQNYDLKEGDFISHDRFGIGVITAVADNMITVQFEGGSRRMFAAGFAPMKRITNHSPETSVDENEIPF